MEDRKTVIITGANGNLGSAVTKAFLDKGYHVVATVAEQVMLKDMPSADRLNAFPIDLSKEEETASFIRSQILEHGTINGALLLVGGFAMGNIAATTGQDIRKQIALNFETAYHVVRPLFAHMMERNAGRIVLIGARPAINASQGKNLIAYGLSKSLLFKLAEFLNEEARGKNVAVAVAAPSTLDTQLNRKSMPEANPDDWVKPQALAEVLEFIISDKASILREPILKVYNNA